VAREAGDVTVPAKLDIVEVSKTFGEANSDGFVQALDRVSFTVQAGEFVSLLGPSGCGKSTLLYMIAGFEQAAAGEIRIDGQAVRGPGADRGLVFQDYALFPWKTLLENVMYGPLKRGLPKSECRDIAMKNIELVGLSGFEKHYPHQLSGGMRQRCALARSVANNPELLLMDEPLAAIDALTRNALQEEILRVCDARDGRPRKTVVYVTHSIDEAVFLSDRIVLMSPRPGRVFDVMTVNFPTPRSDGIRSLPEFHELTGRIWQSLKVYTKPNDGGRHV
jgi:NitT/TauT family transport system ATP-binding protein